MALAGAVAADGPAVAPGPPVTPSPPVTPGPAVVAAPPPAAAPTAKDPVVSPEAPILVVTALANAGVVVDDGRTRVIIDGLFREGVEGYATLPEDLRAGLEGRSGGFQDARLLLVTHWHADHFDAGAVAARLAADPGGHAVVADQVAGQMRALTGLDPAIFRRVTVVTPGPGRHERVTVGGVEVLAVRLTHNPSRNFPDQHLGMGVRLGGRTLLHVGDADPTAENFRAAEALAPVDIAIVPYWYPASEAGRSILRDQLRARHVVAVHVEPDRAAAIRREVEAAWPGAVVLTEPLASATFGPAPAPRR